MTFESKPAFLMSLGLAATLALGGCGRNEPSSTGTANRVENPSLSTTDADFMMKAAQGGMAEVQLSEMAKDKSTNDRVRDFADRLVKDHTNASNQLKDIAAKYNVTLPNALDSKHQDLKERLAKLTGAQFDEDFMKAMIKDHEDDVELFTKEADKGQNADVKTFASNWLPTLQQHLSMARSWNQPTTTSTR